MKRPRRFLLAVVAALLTVAVVAPATAAPATVAPEEAEKRTVRKVYAITGPEFFDAKGRLKVDLSKPGSPERLGIQAKTARAVAPMTDAEARKQAVADGIEYGTPSEKLAKGAVQQADDITLEECRNNPKLSARPEGWIKNHYSYCQLSQVLVVDEVCWGPLCVRIGEFSARITLLSYAYVGLRNVEYVPTLDQVDADGTAEAGAFTYEVECAGLPNRKSCVTADDDVTRTPDQWEENGKATIYFVSHAQPSSPSQGQQIATGVFQVSYTYHFPGESTDSDGPQTSARFDSAWYLAQKQGSIFNRVTPYLSYSVRDEPVKYSAWNIHNAQKFPDSTEPRVAGKQLPGGSEASLLHREFFNKDRRKANRSEAVRYCHQRWPGYSELGQDCDEYPFACTREGAARYRYDGETYRNQYAVKPIPSPDNQEAGRRLGAWFSTDRILHGDGFYVTVTGVDAGEPVPPPPGTPAPPDQAIDCGDGAE